MTNWVSEFEHKFNLRLFGKIESDAEDTGVYFENFSYQWIVRIDQIRSIIEVKKLAYSGIHNKQFKERKIANFLLKNISNWRLIGLEESRWDAEYEITNVVGTDWTLKFQYKEKETPNAFGRFDWSEF